eukprot:TRINITY_DN174_c0_g1_i2.p1 TRINITY_DN174_c0_g1~~TRINITY_DN174_c0_g1_i2.p1  ORF type:complete len:284 (+),score=88.69 TRINITY_DN174_c0_g1_i2:2-853(+)
MDRLGELGGGGGEGAGADIEMGAIGPSESAFMKDFFQQVGEMKGKMARIRQNLADITALHAKFLTAISKTEEKNDELERLMDDTNQLALECKTRLKDMEKKNKEFQGTAAEKRIRENMHGTLTKQFMELISQYQEKQTQHNAQIREKISRQVKITTNKDPTDEDVEKFVRGDQQVFGQMLGKAMLDDIRQRHEDILKLERSIAELHQLFVDMSVLVEAQGELIDQIEHSVNQAVDYVDKGVKELKEANVYQKKSRKKMCCLMLIFVVILVVILAPTLASSKNL